MKRTLLVQDGVLVRQAAMAAGQQALTELQRYYTERKEFYEASKVAYAGVLAVGYYAARDGAGSSSIDDALALLEQCESSTVESQQHLYNMLFLLSRHNFRDQTAEKRAHYRARMKELTANPAIRTDAFAIVQMESLPKWMLLIVSSKAYDPPHCGVNNEMLTTEINIVDDWINLPFRTDTQSFSPCYGVVKIKDLFFTISDMAASLSIEYFEYRQGGFLGASIARTQSRPIAVQPFIQV